ncbi:MAG: LysM peptidoglycan-binding domain-containing protein [Anaerolineales bacterium]
MKHLLRLLVLSTMLLSVLTSCSFFTANAAQSNIALATATSTGAIQLTVQADTSVPFNTVGQVIKYTYTIKNAGTTALTAGQPTDITVIGATVTCAAMNTIGNLDTLLDPNEAITCTSSYPLTQADLDKGSVITNTTAIVFGNPSNPVTTTVTTVPSSVLKLTKTANPATYDHAGQIITYTYIITNSGVNPLGPAQFTVTDAGIGTPINCGDANLTLASNATATCSVAYIVTQADMAAASLSTNATAAGGGVSPSQPSNATVTNASTVQANSTPGSLTAGSSIQHKVVEGEWLWQIARCYGVDPTKLIQANPQLADPAQLKPNSTITVPNIGSAGKVYGPPCVGTHTVQSGDTWSSIAQKYNADPTVLQMVNSNSMAVGTVLKVPLNSAGGVVLPQNPQPTSTTTAGTCSDLVRTVKLTGLPSGATHFNICGTVDASGNTKIFTINITQRSEDVGLGGLTQNITVTSETATPLKNDTSLVVGDMNYDGNDDFRIVKFQPAGPNIPYLYFIYDPATRSFVSNKAYENITSPEFPGNFEIRSQWRESAAKWGIDTYTVANNTPKLTKRETWEAINATQATHQITVINADGTSQMTVNETIPIPTP